MFVVAPLARWTPRLTALAFLLAVVPAWAGNGGFRGGAVGGVMVDADGVLTNAEIDDLGKLREQRLEFMKDLQGDLTQAAGMRKVSLKRLEAAIADRKNKTQVPVLLEDMLFLAGLTRIEYVFVYPEQNDIVLAGPAEPWTVNERGSVVGAKSGSPTLQLDHLLVAFRTAAAAQRNVISCSIDPTPEGIARLNAIKGKLQAGPAALQAIEQAIGMQEITIRGVPETSDFARVMVAADYRMKRLAMGFERSPLGERTQPSYMKMIAAGSSVPQNMMPRWWLAPNYDALLKDEDGLSWQLRGPGVKCMTEDSLFSENGARTLTGKASPMAQRWADTMTANYDALSKKEPIFGELRNVMDMAVVAALIVKENLAEKANCPLPHLTSNLTVNDYPAPKHVETHANAIDRKTNVVISASGGVEINSWAVADKAEVAGSVAPLREKARVAASNRWWWD